MCICINFSYLSNVYKISKNLISKNFVARGLIHTQLYSFPHSLKLMHLQKSLFISVFMLFTKIPVDDINAQINKNFVQKMIVIF